MAAGEHQKLKMLYLLRVLSEETDDRHALSAKEIIRKLELLGVNVDRKTLYKDLGLLEDYGLEIIREQNGRDVLYHLATRTFELPELKLLVDAVQSSRFITQKKSRELIRKLESLTSAEEAKHLHRQVLITGRIKSMNESIYYIVDRLHEAISNGKQIRFRYYRWNVRKEMELRRDGAWYQVSPWCLLWDDENYYLVAFDAADQKIKHYRVDKIVQLSITGEARDGKAQFRQFDAASYSRSQFGMFGGEMTRVSLEGRNEMVGPLIDRFGKDISITPQDAERFTAQVEVQASRHFLAWIIALGDGIRITGPEELVARMRLEAERLQNAYGQPDK
ncbi:MAG: WYL domain-containing transcriptional regulator [Oscillospiraceae bacterium]|nr:WYL domain-containing transcriptional regulator [Oscillospiraceae bacterium]